MKKIIFVIFILLLVTGANAYPVIIHEYGTNITLNKEIVYALPESYYYGLDSITFTNEPVIINGHNKTGRYSVKWYNDYYYDARIWIYGVQIINYTKVEMKDGLRHELCHHQEFYILHKKVANETYADNCELG